jgi:hypothetical protein
MPNQRNTVPWTALAGMPPSFQPAVLSSPSATDDEDDEILFGLVRQSLPADPAYEPTEMPASPVWAPWEEEEEAEAEAPLTWVGRGSLQSCTLASIVDEETPVQHLVGAQVAQIIATVEGMDCLRMQPLCILLFGSRPVWHAAWTWYCTSSMMCARQSQLARCNMSKMGPFPWILLHPGVLCLSYRKDICLCESSPASCVWVCHFPAGCVCAIH